MKMTINVNLYQQNLVVVIINAVKLRVRLKVSPGGVFLWLS